MKFNLLPLLAAATLVGAGCSSTPDKVDSGVIHARTFSFVDRAGKPPADYAENRPEVHAMLQESITKNLSKRGVSKVATGGDVTVAYLVIVGNNAYTTSINDYFGYGETLPGSTTKPTPHTPTTKIQIILRPARWSLTSSIRRISSCSNATTRRGQCSATCLRTPGPCASRKPSTKCSATCASPSESAEPPTFGSGIQSVKTRA